MSHQDEQAPDQAPKRAVYTLREIRINGFSKSLGHLRKRYVTVRIDNGEAWIYRRLGIKDDTLVWNEPTDSKSFEALPTSTLELKLFEAPVVGENGKEVGSSTLPIQSLLDGPEGRTLSLEVKKPKSPLGVTILIVKGEAAAPPNESTGEKPELGEILEDAQDALSRLQRSGDVPGMDKTMTVVHSASTLFNEAGDSWQPLVDKLEGFMNLVNSIAEVHPYAKMAWSVVSAAYKIYKKQKDRDEKVDDLVDKMKAAYDTIMAGATLTELVKRTGQVQAEEGRRADRQHTDVLPRLSIQTVECGQFIAKYAKDRSFLLRAGKQLLLNPNTIMDRFGEKFESLQQEFMQQAVASTEIMTVRVLQTVQKLEIASDLSGLRSVYVKGAGYNTEKQCLPGTRTAALEEISDWINSTDDNAPQICLLLGQAGTGKSTIGHTIASRFRNMKRLGAAFCFSSSAPQQSRHAFATVALDLAAFDTAFKAALWKGVGQDRGDQTTADLTRQFDTFIRKPAQDIAVVSSVLLLLEGLDEIGDVRARAPLLRVLSEHLRELPQGFRVLLTSRPESDICALFNLSSGVMVRDLNTLANSWVLQADIRLFIRTELTKPDLGVHGLDQRHYESLAARSEGLFQWARLACDYIIGDGRRGRGPRQRYEDLLKPQESGPYPRDQMNVLDQLYQRLLPRLLDLEDDQARTRFQRIMGIILHAVEPLTLEAVQGLARHIRLDDSGEEVSDYDVSDILSSLGSLLSGVSAPKTQIRPLHSSFRDFLTIESRSKIIQSRTLVDCYIGDDEIHHANLAAACLRILNTELHFNMCKLDTSYRLNREVPDLQARVEHFISSALAYASRFWAEHGKRQSGWMSRLMGDIKHLLERNFLFWVEVLSLLASLNAAGWALSTLIPLLRTSNVGLADLATDGLRFVHNQAYPISESTPHLYMSALVSMPTGSLIHSQYNGQYPQRAQMCHGRREEWPWPHDILKGHTSWVQSVAFSPDGKRIVSGSDDKTIRIWDAEGGIPVGDPLEGHTGSVRSVAFSPDGKRIVSGSDDNTIRIWDAESGIPVGDPLEGHTGSVWSVVFSPDGKRIVSSSDDNTIRIWDAESGIPVGAPLEGHTSSVQSVAFSPDGKQIVSGSYDKTIRIWDAESGIPVGAPLEGHTNWVKAVAFSPDGKRIVSGSYDNTIRIWDAESALYVGAPLKGHTDSVRSVAFSPDGKRIVSGSYDKTIRIWDAESATHVGAPLKGHTGSVQSVAFSPDGERIVSGSYDETIRICDAESGIPVGAPLDGHTSSVRSVAFSPDGKRIVSGSDDNTIRIWDAKSGIPVGAPLEGHTSYVQSAAFSPDGKRIVSGSGDYTIRIWDAESGTPVGAPLEGHTSSVRCVAFSPDGKRIVSGSDDKTIRIWDAKSGIPVGAPLEGHTSYVQSVVFSPDGKQIVSGSYDKTIRIWETQSGIPVGAPLEGHTDSVESVAFSSDGKRIVSGSDDNSVRIWDAQSGIPVGAPLEGHTSYVQSVAFSPDGKRIVSGAYDNNIRIWDAESGIPFGALLEGHTDSVQSVAFSPDGKRVVSSSGDQTIRLWDVASGTPVGRPLEEHTDSVRPVAPSPDPNWIMSANGHGTSRMLEAGIAELRGATPDVEERTLEAPSIPVLLRHATSVISMHGSRRISWPETLFRAISFCPDVDHSPGQPLLLHDGAPPRVSFNIRSGWITCNESDYLFWLSPEQLKYLCTPGCRLVIPTSKMVTLDMRRFVHGERWTECYQPG